MRVYSSVNHQLTNLWLNKITNAESGETPEITLDEIKHALSQLKNGRAPREDGIAKQM